MLLPSRAGDGGLWVLSKITGMIECLLNLQDRGRKQGLGGEELEMTTEDLEIFIKLSISLLF